MDISSQRSKSPDHLQSWQSCKLEQSPAACTENEERRKTSIFLSACSNDQMVFVDASHKIQITTNGFNVPNHRAFVSCLFYDYVSCLVAPLPLWPAELVIPVCVCVISCCAVSFFNTRIRLCHFFCLMKQRMKMILFVKDFVIPISCRNIWKKENQKKLKLNYLQDQWQENGWQLTIKGIGTSTKCRCRTC